MRRLRFREVKVLIQEHLGRARTAPSMVGMNRISPTLRPLPLAGKGPREKPRKGMNWPAWGTTREDKLPWKTRAHPCEVGLGTEHGDPRGRPCARRWVGAVSSGCPSS